MGQPVRNCRLCAQRHALRVIWQGRGTTRGGATFHPRRCAGSAAHPCKGKQGVSHLNGIIYLVGLVVVVLAILSFIGLR